MTHSDDSSVAQYNEITHLDIAQATLIIVIEMCILDELRSKNDI